jgi:glucose/arabinose dehydrogenase
MSRLPALALLSLLSLAMPAAAAEHYTPEKATCDGWPRAPIGMAKGFCAGLVVTPPAAFERRQLRMPRLLLPLPGGRAGGQASGQEWLVTDMRNWGDRDGRVWRLRAERGQPVQLTSLLRGLALPHGLGRGPDGKVYVGEMGRIFRFDPQAPNPARTMETVIAGLPSSLEKDFLHPLAHFIFDGDGALLVNTGSPSDQCEAKGGKPNGTRVCNESEGSEPTAGVRRYAYRGNGVWDKNFTMLARGLRNSLALARHGSGTLLQGENSIDFTDAFSPAEELNVLLAGAHYGWPYCYDMNRPAPVWARAKAMDCRSARHTPPALLLPPHSAPLSMLYYNGAMFPELRGKLLLSLHGYQPSGARLVAFSVDAKGIPVTTSGVRYPFVETNGKSGTKPYPAGPAAEPLQLTPQWHEQHDRPTGTPLGLAVAEDGAIWLAEDKNGAILRIARDRP